MFLPILGYTEILIYSAAALVPAIILMYYVYRQDKVEKEPGRLLGKLVLGGVFAALISIVLEGVAQIALSAYLQNTYMSYAGSGIITATYVALIEEITKFFFLYKFSWRDPAFNYRFDGIVYAVFVSLGFAAFENILYIFFYGGLSVALPRALLAIPAHMSFAVYMGLLYGFAKQAELKGDTGRSNLLLVTGYLMAVLLHATYDGSIMIGSDAAVTFFACFVVVLDIVMLFTVHKASKTDERLY